MNCPKCKQENPEASLYCNHCGYELAKAHRGGVSTKAIVLTCLGGVLVAVISVFCWMYGPLDNEEELYKSGVELHELKYKLRIIAGQNAKCGADCPVCHPHTWQWGVRKRLYFDIYE